MNPVDQPPVGADAELRQELEQLAYVVSHDLQAPLRTLISFNHLLVSECEAELSDDARQYVQFIDQSARRMRKMVEDLTLYSRVLRMPREQDAIDLNEACKQVRAGLAKEIDATGADLAWQELPTARGNTQAITQLLSHLVANAVKFCADGDSPRVRITAREAPDRADYFCLCVSDNGIGLPVASQAEAFEMFRRLHNDEERYPGLGMGLTICNKIVQQHGGRLWVEAGAGGGTTMCCTLPRQGG